MKKILLSLVLFAGIAFVSSAQKFALIDMEYILKNVPQYEMANEQLNQLSQRWQKEVEAVSKGVGGAHLRIRSAGRAR